MVIAFLQQKRFINLLAVAKIIDYSDVCRRRREMGKRGNEGITRVLMRARRPRQ
jgi:hypothetical protein